MRSPKFAILLVSVCTLGCLLLIRQATLIRQALRMIPRDQQRPMFTAHMTSAPTPASVTPTAKLTAGQTAAPAKPAAAQTACPVTPTANAAAAQTAAGAPTPAPIPATAKTTAAPTPSPVTHTARSLESDGAFNGFPIYKVNRPPQTHIHCVGENFQKDRSWLFRSCRYETFCFDTKGRNFVVFPQKPRHASEHRKVWTSTHSHSNFTHVAAGAQNKRWWPQEADTNETKTIGRYKPEFIYPDGDVPTSYYRFNATWMPFHRHQRSPYNPGHLVWDDFLGLYTLLDIFGRTRDNLLLTHMFRQATADFKGDDPPPGHDIIQKFLPLMGQYHNYELQTLECNYSLQLKHKNVRYDERYIICADNALIGSGLFSDHGYNHWHGQNRHDFDYPHNHGSGGRFRRYRRWMMENVGVNPDTPIQRHPYLIVVSESSTTKKNRGGVNFTVQVEALRKTLGDRAEIRCVQLPSLSLIDQIELISKTAIFISVVGGGTVTGTFLPEGASAILYHRKHRLDWDFWNNFPQVKTHWFRLPSRKSMNETEDVSIIVDVVQAQLDYLDSH